MRKLASIQEIKNLEPIPGADAIEKATVLGWQLVVKKGEFAIGDRCVYCEIDALLPEKPEFEFLRQRKFRIKTVRLRGQVSQGIAFPMSLLMGKGEFEPGQDVTEVLEITQWQPKIPACLAGLVKGSFPAFVPKTDETRVQVLGDVLKRYVGTKCYVTEKVDGASATYYLKDGEFGVCSRNLDLKESEGNAFWQFAREAKIEEKLREVGGNWAIQGELVGNGIQGNNLGIIGKKVLFFSAFDINAYRYLDFEDFEKFFIKIGLETVPILERDYTLVDDIDSLVKKSVGRSAIAPKVWREGIVIRPLKEVVDLGMSSLFNNGRLSFKVVNLEYLLECEQ